MPNWDKRSKIIVQNDEGNTIAVKNRFPPSDSGATQTLSAILTRLQSGIVEFDSIVITVHGVQRDDVALLMTGSRRGVVGERDFTNRDN
jgi:hypothetical protein